MALKDNWKDLENGIEGVPDSGDDISVEPINAIAHAVIEIEENGAGGSSIEAENPVFSGTLTIDGVEIYRDDSFEEKVVVERPASSNGAPSSAFSFGYDQAFLSGNELYHNGNLKNLAAQGNALDEIEKNAFMKNTGLDVVVGDIDTAIDEIIEIQNTLIGGDA